MHIKETDTRARKWEYLREATGENTTSGALDTAADFYLNMAGHPIAEPTGALEELMQLAVNQGSVTPAEIATVLDTDELPVEYQSEWAVGVDE